MRYFGVRCCLFARPFAHSSRFVCCVDPFVHSVRLCRVVLCALLLQVETLRFKNKDYDARIRLLSKESDELQEQKAAITKAIEELRLGLKFESTISSKVSE